MIITRSPLRITLGGGGTDLPSYYHQHGGFCISAAIDKYVYVTVLRPFVPGIYLKYSEIEHVDCVDNVKHPIIREAIRLMDLKTPQLEITTLTDIPAGTGLGSSSSFTTALLKAICAHRRRFLHPANLAEIACKIEIDILANPIGKQDQYIATFGGVMCLTFMNDSVVVRPLDAPIETLFALEDNLLLFFTGYARQASDVLRDQQTRTETNDLDMLANLHQVKVLARETQCALQQGDLTAFGQLLHEQWELKKRRLGAATNPHIDEWYTRGLANGAIGGKLVGAGGGGFLLFYTTEHQQLRASMIAAGLEEVRFRFDYEGTKVLLS